MEVCLGCLRNLALGGESNVAKLLASPAGCAGLVVKAMGQHQGNEPTLQEQACLTVEALAAASSEHAAALNAAGADVAVEGSKALITNERNKAYPDRAIAALRK